MKKKKYKDQNNNNNVISIVALLVLIFIFFLAEQLLEIYNNRNTQIDSRSLSTIKDVIEYHKSTYISEKKSAVENFKTDAYVKFKMLPYENNVSNEEYYTKLIEDCARVVFYKSFRLIDEKNDIIIQVICDNNKIVSIIINGIEDYFIYMDSQLSMEEYVEIPLTEVNVDSEILQSCIDNNWKDGTVEFGSRESIFNGYYIYFDEGIEVRSISGKIYNLIFNKNYNSNVISSIFPGMDNESIESVLGKPQFKDNELNLIGYKTEKFYIFFSESEISVYRNTEEETDDFFKLADDFIAEKIDLLEFMNQLTYIWPDYSDYKYNSSSVFISYPLKGLEIKINYDDINGILLYNNIRASLPKVGRYLENTYFVARLQLDLVFSSEKRRIENNEKMKDNCLEFKNSLNEAELKIIGESLKYDIYPLKDDNGYIFSMRFISKNDDMPNRELNDGINSYMWLGDFFLYSKRSKGIFIYDINSGFVSRLITGEDEFNIKGYENGILKYDDKEISIQY